MKSRLVPSILTIALTVLIAHAADNPRGMKIVYGESRSALVIGNSTYAANPLVNPMNDATDVARLLEQRKFKVRLLTNADKAAMEAAIDEFGQRLQQGGVGLFYYAGHAMQIGGVNYLLPVDARVRKESDVKRQGLDAGVLLDEMDSSRNRLNVVILDACRDNPFARSFRSAGQGLAKMDAPRGTLIAYATSPGRTAADGEERNGVYTKHLLEQMTVPGKELGNMFKAVRKGVIKDTTGAQTPWESTSVTGDFYFTPIDILDDNLDLTADELARYKKLLAEQQAAEARMKQLEDRKNASIAQMERQIESLRKKLNQPGSAGGTLAQLAALADQREKYAKDLVAAKAKAEQERRVREAEMAQLRAQEVANRKKKFDAAYANYRKVVDSKYMRDAEKQQAWTLICSNWNVADAVDAPGILFWDDQTGVVSAKTAGQRPGQNVVVDLGGGVDIELVWIEPGSFVMGSPASEDGRDDDEKQHRVTLSKGFWMGKYEVTQAQWQQVMGSNPSHFKNAGKQAPVENVSWNDCQGFVRKLNGKGVDGTFSLPTEAQWEYACRAGTRTALYNGKLTIRGARNGPELDDIAWYGGNSEVSYSGGDDSSAWKEKQYNHSKAGTHPVGQKKANLWGLHDMVGNVWEWCDDWYGTYPTSSVSDPSGPSSGSDRVLRGGAWDADARFCRSADRGGVDPSGRDNLVGLRVVLFR